MSRNSLNLGQLFIERVIWVGTAVGLIVVFIFVTFALLRARATQITTTIPSYSCLDLIKNGGFEEELTDWDPTEFHQIREFNPTTIVSPVFAGTSAARVGIMSDPSQSFVNAIRQKVFLPPSAITIVLRFQYLPKSRDISGQDSQYIDVYDADTDLRISRVFSDTSYSNSWTFGLIDLTEYRGKNIGIEFGVENDGLGGGTALLIDDISLLTCFDDNQYPLNAVTASISGPNLAELIIPTITPTPTRVPLPTAYVLPTPTPDANTIDFENAPMPDRPSFPSLSIADCRIPDNTNHLGYVILMNRSEAISLDGWTLSDGSSNTFRFFGIVAPATSVLRIELGTGPADEFHPFASMEAMAISTNEQNYVSLKNPHGNIVDRFPLSPTPSSSP